MNENEYLKRGAASLLSLRRFYSELDASRRELREILSDSAHNRGLEEEAYLQLRAANESLARLLGVLAFVGGPDEDPAKQTLRDAPIDDEPLTPEDEAKLDQAREELPVKLCCVNFGACLYPDSLTLEVRAWPAEPSPYNMTVLECYDARHYAIGSVFHAELVFAGKLPRSGGPKAPWADSVEFDPHPYDHAILTYGNNIVGFAPVYAR